MEYYCVSPRIEAYLDYTVARVYTRGNQMTKIVFTSLSKSKEELEAAIRADRYIKCPYFFILLMI